MENYFLSQWNRWVATNIHLDYLFKIKIRHEIHVAPMKKYIEEWFKKAINKLTNKGHEIVDTVLVTINEDDKRTSTSK
jgi:hypothetical protein